MRMRAEVFGQILNEISLIIIIISKLNKGTRISEEKGLSRLAIKYVCWLEISMKQAKIMKHENVFNQK
jgi:hypothetical protein